MNLLNLLIKEKSAIGVEINTDVVRVAYFSPKKTFINKINTKTKSEISNDLVLIEEPIPADTIVDGCVVNKPLLSKILRNIWRKQNLTKSYAIVSIPTDKIYTNLFPFPKTINNDHLVQAVELAIDFQLPFNKKDVYIGWESHLNEHNTNEVIISTIPKKIANDYIEVLNNANINVLALESHIASIARSINLKADEATLISLDNQDSKTLFILKNSNLKFSRTLPCIFLKDNEALSKEITNIKNSFETEYKEKVTEISFINATINDHSKKYFEGNDTVDVESKWLISLGGALRGEIKGGEDKAISLLPISMTEAYKYQKIKTFISLIRNTVIGVSVFFLFAHFAAYIFILSLSETVKNVTANVTVPANSQDVAGKEELLRRINSLTNVSSMILSTTPNWSILIDEISSRTISGITITSLSIPSITDNISIVGISSNRDVLNLFKKNLQDSAFLSSVELPITNLEQKADIPFSISLKVKNPSMLYYK